MTMKKDDIKSMKEDLQVFIETGTNNGGGVQLALDCEFDKIISIEFYDKLYEKCCKLFEGNDKVELHQGDSGVVLNSIIENLNERALFWFDSHFSVSSLYTTPLVDSCPILRELDTISKSKINNHTILIDDMRYFKTGIPLWNQIREESILERLRQINPNYKITYVDGYVANDVLVAKI